MEAQLRSEKFARAVGEEHQIRETYHTAFCAGRRKADESFNVMFDAEQDTLTTAMMVVTTFIVFTLEVPLTAPRFEHYNRPRT